MGLAANKDHALPLAQRAHAHRHVAQQLAHIHLAHVERKARVLQPRKLQQVNNHSLQALALGQHLADIRPHVILAGNNAVAQRFQRTADDRDGRFEFVRNRREKRTLLLAEALVPSAGVVKPLRQNIHRARQLADFVLPRVLHPRVVFAARQPARKALNRRDRLGEHARKERAQQRGQREGNRAAEQQDIRAGNLREAQLAQRAFQQHHAKHVALGVHNRHARGQMRFSVDFRGEKRRFAHEPQRDRLLDVIGEHPAAHRLHHAVEIARHAVLLVDEIDVAIRDMLDQRHIRRERILADDEGGFIQRLVIRRRDHLREILRNGICVALHGLAVMGDHFSLHHRVEKQLQHHRKQHEQQREKPRQARDERSMHRQLHGRFLSNL